MANLKNKVIFITGASRGIGKAIALKAAKDGAKIVVASKTTDAHPKLPGTIYTTAQEIEALGGEAFAIKTDIRDNDQIIHAVDKTLEKFGAIDILINNASAIFLDGIQKTPVKKFNLMMEVNTRATYALSQACLPHLLKSKSPHILTISPPINLDPKWFVSHCAYTISKYGMSMCTIGISEEFKEHNIKINSLWPKTTIATSAVQMLGGEALIQASRNTDIMVDAAYWIFTQCKSTGNFFIDEDIITKEIKCEDLKKYSVSNKKNLAADLFI